MTEDPQIHSLAEELGRQLLAGNRRLVTAESCTGGWLAKAVTAVSGSSRWFECGTVPYSNAAKARDLRVAERTLERHGAVSEAVAREMAVGALQVSGADVALAITGIAGPAGGSPEKPVGTVWFSVAVRRDATHTDLDACLQQFTGGREAIRRDSVRFALEWLVSIQLLSSGRTV